LFNTLFVRLLKIIDRSKKKAHNRTIPNGVDLTFFFGVAK